MEIKLAYMRYYAEYFECKFLINLLKVVNFNGVFT